MAQEAFDTLSVAQRLEEEFEFSPKQAEGTAKLIYEHLTGTVATKDDFKALNDKIDDSVKALKGDMKALNDKIDDSVKALTEKMATKAELAEVKTEILKWMFGALLAQTGIILAVMKLL